MTKRLHVPALDGLRVAMVFMVSWYHIWQQSWLGPQLSLGPIYLNFEPYVRTGYLLVDGMILLSGFVLFLPYAQCMNNRQPLPEILPFYGRRLARVLPSYLFMLAVMLFGIAIPQHRYANAAAMWQDILSHLTFTFLFSPSTYLHTPLNMAAWTLCVEMQFYLIFPFLARAMVKRPALTLIAMIEAGFLYRLYCAQTFLSYDMLVNQLISFMDVFALGMLSAMLYVRFHRRLKGPGRALMLLVAAFGLFMVSQIMYRQAGVVGFAQIQRWQMIRRFPLALGIMLVALGVSLSFKWVQTLLGNRVIRFLAAVSMNYYLWHQVLSVQLKVWRVPPYEDPTPQMAGEMPWQIHYTWLCFALALLWAALITYGLEKPAARGLQKLFTPKRKEELS
ncbi:MAG: acyltransferase [Clostridia bacterium]|nr:acyltransferase [Clostridia bacterium]